MIVTLHNKDTIWSRTIEICGEVFFKQIQINHSLELDQTFFLIEFLAPT